MRRLEDLNRVAWSSLRHAYGPATDVPDMVRALAAASDTEAAAEAEHPLWCAVLHQGGVCDAAAPTLPFIIWLLSTRPELRPSLVSWLGDLAWVLRADREDDAVAECRGVLEQAVDPMVPLLADSDIEVRTTVAGFLGECTRRAADVWPALAERFETETSVQVQADLLISMARVAAPAGREHDTRRCAEAWWESTEAAKRSAAAHAYCILDPSDSAASSLLINSLPHGRPLGLWWGAGSPRFIIETLSASPGWLQSPETLDTALACVAESGDFAGAEILRLILQDVFPGGHQDVPRSAADLTSRQRHVVEFFASGRVQFAEPRDGYTIVRSTQPLLRTYHLPADVEPLRRWLARTDRHDSLTPAVRDKRNRRRPWTRKRTTPNSPR